VTTARGVAPTLPSPASGGGLGSGSSRPTAAEGRKIALHNRVLPVLVAAGAAAMLGSGFLTLAPNRLVSGQPVGLFAAADLGLSAAIAALGLALLAAAFAPPSRVLHRATAVVAGILLLLVLAAAGDAASRLAATAPSLARAALGAGFWILFAAAALAVIDGLQRAGAGYPEQIAFAAAIAAGSAALAYAGVFDSLSLAREYQTRQSVFAAALLRHVVLVAAAVAPAVLIGFPLGVAAVRRRAMQGPLFAVLNLLQTVPSIALFGLLIVPLSALAVSVPALGALGVAGIGAAPAIIALVLYALLPVVRNTVAGISGVDPAVVDAARGMGMTTRQLFWRVELPLALPLLLAGLRIVLVQAIGLAVVAALIGAGGLGTFVFEGLGQYAADLVLFGALPAIALALAADFLLQMLASAASRR
jgi:osmoprotectant transport system permease protein